MTRSVSCLSADNHVVAHRLPGKETLLLFARWFYDVAAIRSCAAFTPTVSPCGSAEALHAPEPVRVVPFVVPVLGFSLSLCQIFDFCFTVGFS